MMYLKSTRHILLAFLAISLLPLSSSAALPPLSPEELDADAEVIVTGTVTSNEIAVTGSLSHTRWVIELQVKLDSVIKGDGQMEPGWTLPVQVWKVRKSKSVGAQGQNDIPAAGSRAQFWLEKNSHGDWEALEPNGISLLDGGAELDLSHPNRMYTVRQIFIYASLVTGAGMVFLVVFVGGRKGRKADATA